MHVYSYSSVCTMVLEGTVLTAVRNIPIWKAVFTDGQPFSRHDVLALSPVPGAAGCWRASPRSRAAALLRLASAGALRLRHRWSTMVVGQIKDAIDIFEWGMRKGLAPTVLAPCPRHALTARSVLRRAGQESCKGMYYAAMRAWVADDSRTTDRKRELIKRSLACSRACCQQGKKKRDDIMEAYGEAQDAIINQGLYEVC